jgi:hypothetical protein
MFQRNSVAAKILHIFPCPCYPVSFALIPHHRVPRIYKCWRLSFILFLTLICAGVRGSIVGWGTMLQTGRSRVQFPMRWIFFTWPNPSSRTMALGSAQPLTEISTKKIPGGVKRGRRIRLTTLLPSVSWRCGSLDLSHPYGPSRPVTGIALLTYFYFDLCCIGRLTCTLPQYRRDSNFRW